MARELVIGLDLGTTSVKAVLFDMNGKLIAESEKLNTTNYPQPDWVEQNPEEIEQSCVCTMKEVIAKADVQKGELLTVGIACAMHSIICVDTDFKPLSPMIIWADGRSSEQAKKLRHIKGREIYARTGTPIHPMSPFVKLLWMKETCYEPYQKAAYFMSMKEYLLQKWFGKFAIDYSMASATGLLNIRTLQWDKEALEIAGVQKEQLAEMVPPTTVLTGMQKDVAEEIGISTELPFVIGAADGQLANLGNGAISPGEAAISVGTSGAIRQFTNNVRVSEKQDTFTYLFTEDTAIVGGPTNNGGIALQWLKDLLEFEGSFDELIAGAEQVKAGADGIIFLPYVNGERAPLWNEHAKGNLYGLTVGHKKEHLVRAVLEGITFNIYQIGKSLEEIAGEPRKISVNGGLAKSSLFVQMVADVFGKEVHLPSTHHSAAWGAAWTALIGIKKVDSFEAIKQNIPIEKVVQPNQAQHKIYEAIYQKYEQLAGDLAAYFE